MRAFEEAPGLRPFAPSLRRVEWPPKFRPEMPPRYDCTEDPSGFLQAYEEAVWAAGGDDKVKANWLPMALVGVPHVWLLNMPASSMASWEELCDLFLAHYAALAPPVVAALLGGSQVLPSGHHLKPFVRQIGTALTWHGAPPGLAAPKAELTFISYDHPVNTAYSGALPMLSTPTIY